MAFGYAMVYGAINGMLEAIYVFGEIIRKVELLSIRRDLE